jgi:hypothetical protein
MIKLASLQPTRVPSLKSDRRIQNHPAANRFLFGTWLANPSRQSEGWVDQLLGDNHAVHAIRVRVAKSKSGWELSLIAQKETASFVAIVMP